MTESDRSELISQSIKDERKRDRDRYDYSFDVLSRQWAVPFSIWPTPNTVVRQIIDGEVEYNDLPYDHLNEVQKGMFWTEQVEFVAKHADQKIICESLGRACLLHECELYVAAMAKNHERPVCREYKFMFEKGGVADPSHDIDDIKTKEPSLVG